MKMTAKVADMLNAVRRMRVELVELQARFPFVTVSAADGAGAVYASDGISFVESQFPAEVEEEGIFQIGKQFDAMLPHIRDEVLTLNTVNKSLSFKGDRGFKARLQTIDKDPVPRSIVIEKMNNILIDIDVDILKADLTALIHLCKLFPATGTSAPWATLTIGPDAIIGSTPGAESGAVEEMPLGVVRTGAMVQEPVTIRAYINRIENLVALCNNEVNIQTCPEPTVPLFFRDPHNPVWWALTAKSIDR